VFFQLKTAKFGQVSASCFLKTNITNLVSTSSTMRFSSYAWMIPLQIPSRICVTIFCAELTTWKEANRLGRVRIGGMIKYVVSFYFDLSAGNEVEVTLVAPNYRVCGWLGRDKL
jgi:hypothetical protein